MRVYVIKSKGYRANKETGEVIEKAVCEDSVMWCVDDGKNAQIAAGCVCDGVGSLRDSVKAAEYTANKLKEFIKRKSITGLSDSDIIRAIEDKILEIHNSKYWDSEENYRSATTLVFIVFDKKSEKYFIANVGDSRCYYADIKNKKLSLLTEDQEDEVGRLTSAINKNQKEEIEIDITDGEIKKGDVFLIASDGLFKKMNDKELMERLVEKNSHGYKNVLANIEKELRTRGEKDDITALIMEIQ